MAMPSTEEKQAIIDAQDNETLLSVYANIVEQIGRTSYFDLAVSDQENHKLVKEEILRRMSAS